MGRRLLLAAIALAGHLQGMGSATAQVYPSHPVTMVVPFPAAGPADVLARILGERMRVSLGQPVIIDNVAGAAGSIAGGPVPRAAPHRYTLNLREPGTPVVHRARYTRPVDPHKRFGTASLS